MDRGAWWAAVHGVTKSQTWLSDFPFTFHFHALEKEVATHSGALAWRIPGTGEPGGLPSMRSHRVRHDWSDSSRSSSWETVEDRGAWRASVHRAAKSWMQLRDWTPPLPTLLIISCNSPRIAILKPFCLQDLPSSFRMALCLPIKMCKNVGKKSVRHTLSSSFKKESLVSSGGLDYVAQLVTVWKRRSQHELVTCHCTMWTGLKYLVLKMSFFPTKKRKKLFLCFN